MILSVRRRVKRLCAEKAIQGDRMRLRRGCVAGVVWTKSLKKPAVEGSTLPLEAAFGSQPAGGAFKYPLS
jgi:hypothetical protein